MLVINPPIFAHRGANLYAPENTLAAFKKAHVLGIKWLEFDVMLSADDEVVVFHDDNLDRTTDKTGRVLDFKFSDLKKLDAGAWFHPKFSNERIPSFQEVIKFLRENKMAANVEIKPYPGLENKTTEKVMAEIAKYWDEEITPPLVSSFSLQVLKKVRALSATVDIGFLMHEWNPQWRAICHELNCASVDVNEAIITPEMVQLFKKDQRLVFSYTVNNPLRAKELFSFGVDAVYSDCPDIILNQIRES